jgi:predicted nucleic-acid-binding protein
MPESRLRQSGGMLAIETNLVVRYLTDDDPSQSARARSLIDGQGVFVCTTVLLETEWILRSVYGLPSGRITPALRAFAGLSGVTVEDPGATAQALTWTDGGMDFADALHLSKTAGCDAFISFDRRFARVANRLSTVKVRSP